MTARGRSFTGFAAAVMVTGLAIGCQTRGAKTEPSSPVATVTQFEPLASIASIEKGEGQYPNVYAPASYAVWVTPEVVTLKREQAVKAGVEIAPSLDTSAKAISSNYIVIECHMDTAFPDASVGYDAVRFRGFDTYLEVPNGRATTMRAVQPVQTYIDPEGEERQQGTIKAFSRTNLLIFSRKDLVQGVESVPTTTPAVRLVLEGVHSRFTFAWQGVPTGQASAWKPAAEDAVRAAKLGFRDLYTNLSKLSHTMD